MNLDDLSAAELAPIDQVCLEFERRFETDEAWTVEEAVGAFVARSPLDNAGGETRTRTHIELLRRELQAIESELSQKSGRPPAEPVAAPTPFQAKTGDDAEAANPRTSRVFETQWFPQADFSQRAGPSQAVDPSQAAGDSNAGRPFVGQAEQPLQSIGPYKVGRLLARGGMGVVYQAVDTRLDRPVAIKMLGFDHLAASDAKRIGLVERFEREAKAVAALSHPNIVELFDVGVVGHVPYAVMEYLRGSTLAEYLSNGPLSPEQTRQLGMQISGALAAAHEAGVVHRDLKPQNVMLIDSKASDDDAAPHVKLLDFGLSRVSDSAFADQDGDQNPTRSGTILGTPGYMAPEQARGESATSAADMFGLGCVLYEAFHGRPAIPGETPADRLADTLRGEVQYDAGPCEKSAVLCELISECLKKDPKGRPTASDVYVRLRQFDSSTLGRMAPNASAASAGTTSFDGSATGPNPDGLSNPGGLLRRHALTTLLGAIGGGLLGGVSIGVSDAGLKDIRFIAVLKLRDLGDTATRDSADGMPLADKQISDGDILASVLVNELSAVDGLAVVPYRPLTAETPAEFERLGGELGVDAFVTGSFATQTLGQQKFWILNWQLVRASDGRLLKGNEYVTEQKGANPGIRFLAQSDVASDIARQIGKAVITSGQQRRPPDPMAYGCMMKGNAYADNDSTKGLRQALLCYGKAHEEDPRLSEPLASIALASLNLAARSASTEESLGHLEEARRSMTEALALNPDSVRAQLAKAMIQWQSLHHFNDAFRLLEMLDREHPFDPLVQHQRGLLLTTLGRADEAIRALQTAAKLNPMSILIRTDLCRTRWFFGFDSRAIDDATRYEKDLDAEHPAKHLVVGFLVDVFEGRRDYRRASETLGLSTDPTDAESYYRERESTLRAIPYGPFGAALNRAIFDLRTGTLSTANASEILGRLDDAGATLFSLVLAQHPAFAALRATPAAQGYLPSMDPGYPTA